MELENTEDLSKKDNYNYLNENSNPPSYHNNQDCELLKSDYDPVLVIPQEIKTRQMLIYKKVRVLNYLSRWSGDQTAADS